MQTVSNYAFNDAEELGKALLDVQFDAGKDSVVYIENAHGQRIGNARLREDILSDGSKAYTLVLIEEV